LSCLRAFDRVVVSDNDTVNPLSAARVYKVTRLRQRIL
jgi:hypothetical protein